MEFFSIAVSGAVSGAIYALLAIGLVLSYQTSRIFNFGHAATAFASAYVYYQLHVALEWNQWLVLAIVLVVFAPLMGWTWDRLVFSKLIQAEESTKIVAGVGVLVVVPAVTVLFCTVLQKLFGIAFQDIAEVYLVPGVLPAGQHTIAPGLSISNNQIAALTVSIVLFLALWGLLRFSPLGLRMRASVDSPQLAQLRGIDTARVSTLSWMISFWLAAIAGILAAPFPGPFGLLNDNYTLALFIAITAAVVARLSSIPIAFVAGLALGAGRNVVVAYVNEDHLGTVGGWLADIYGLTASVPFVVLFIALIWLGHDKRLRKAGSIATSVTSVPDYRDDLTPFQKARPWIIMSAIVMIPALTVMNEIWLQLVILGFALGLIFLSYTILTGLGGMVSLAQGAFATASALTVGMLLHQGWSFAPALVVGVAVSCALGALTALPALRVSGLSLTFATLALALLATNVLFKMEWFSNGPLGWSIPRPSFGPLDLTNDKVFLVLTFVLVLVMVKMCSNLSNSATGRAIIALRTAESAAASSGISPRATKLTLFILSAGVAGLGGVVMALVYGTVLGTANPPQASFLWLAIVVIIGVRSPGGAIIAGIVCSILPHVVSHGMDLGFVQWGGTNNDLIAQVLFGIGAIQLAAQPNGALSDLSRTARRRRDAKRAKAHAQGFDVVAPAVAAPMSVMPRVNSVDVDEPGDALLVISGVKAAYGEVEVLHDVSLTARKGEILALLGANGSGKSTLCSTIGGIVPISTGQILFDGEDITGLDAAGRGERGIVLVPESRGIFPALTVEQNLRVTLPRREDRELVYERFAALKHRLKQPAGNLSGGEQQMLSLAPFLVRPPKLLIGDEPSLGLAQIITAEIMAMFQQLRDEGTTVILVEEKARDVLRVADRVGALQRGELAWLVDSAQVDAERIASAYLGMSKV